MNHLSLKFIFAKAIDLITSVSTIAVFYLLVGSQLELISQLFTIGIFSIIPLILNSLLFKFFNVQTLGEAIMKVKKTRSFRFYRFHRSLEADDSLPFIQRISYMMLSLFLVTAPLLTDQVIDQYSTNVTGLKTSNLKWKPFKHPEDDWKIEFPTKPSTQEKVISLPNSSELTLSEITSKQEKLSFSIASATLPENLLKWSPNLILKASIKILANNLEKVESSTDKIFKYKNFPTLPYTLTQGEKVIFGRLILIEDTLYKLEVECPKAEKELHQEKLNKFFNSFSPT
jgi:hypothetical protein